MILGGQFLVGHTITWIQVFLLEGGIPPILQALEPQGLHSSPTLGASCPVPWDVNWGQVPRMGNERDRRHKDGSKTCPDQAANFIFQPHTYIS